MKVRDVHYEADGLRLVGRLAVPDGDGPFAGVLSAHEANGNDDVQLGRAERLAEHGYVGFALDYHGPHAPFADRRAMNARLDELSADPDRIRALGAAALETMLLTEPRIDADRVAATGYCYGGTVALELARAGANLRAVVGFHPGMRTSRPEDAVNIKGKVLMLVGADDPYVTPADRAAFEEEMRAASVDWQLHLYGGVQHTFTHPWAERAGIPGLAYDATAAARSWQAMLDLFAEVL
jgi:dienelactone hydrolase